MNRSFLLTIVSILLFSPGFLKSQTFPEQPVMPYHTNASPIFGKDIVIHDHPERNQRNIAICSAFNGWLFAVYSYDEEYFQDLSILKSVDNGITWEVLLEGGTGVVGSIITRLEIIACGNTLDNLKLFLGFTYYDPQMKVSDSYIWRASADPFVIEENITDEPTVQVTDFVIASDYLYTSGNSNPYGVGLLYIKRGVKDTLIFRSSSNGGMVFENRRIITTATQFFHKVALSYGRSPSWSNGRYFAVWEEQPVSQTETLGHIYTAHTGDNINGPFSTRVCLDSLNSEFINKVRNPTISCQVSDADNDSASLTEAVMFEKYSPVTNRFDLAGYYNLQAPSSNYFRSFTATPSSYYNLQPDINFNHYNSTFMLTYFDQTNQSLPLLSHNVNMVNPDSWDILTSHYNDSVNITKPYPKVRTSTSKQDGMNVWTADKPNGNGIALFDAPYSTWTGSSEKRKTDGVTLLSTYPNPCNNIITICFELTKAEKVSISLYTIMGQPIGIIADQNYSTGKHNVRYNISHLTQGSYYCEFVSGSFHSTEKIIVIR